MLDKTALQKALQSKRKELEYSEDFPAFCRDKLLVLADAEWVPFELNDAQLIVYETIAKQMEEVGKVDVICLKARQIGISTLTSAYIYWRMFYGKNLRASVMAHKAEATTDIFSMTQNFILRHKGHEGKKGFNKFNLGTIEFPPENGGLYRTYTALGEESGRGATQNLLHLTEVAFWKHLDDIKASLLKGQSRAKGSVVIYESTANSKNGFYDMWKKAEAQVEAGNPSATVPIFVPWHVRKDYRDPTWDGLEDLLTDEDRAYQKEHGLDDNQMAWRYNIILEDGSEKFKQEFPATAEEAFLSSGSGVFDSRALNMIQAKAPISAEVYDSKLNTFTRSSEIEGHLQVFRPTGNGERFVIGADVAQGGEGDNADYSTAVVLSENFEVVATFQGRRIPPPEFARALYILGYRFNNALIAVENNTIGDGCARMLKELKYSNLYYRDANNHYSSTDDSLPGFRTDTATRPAIIGGLQEAVRQQSVGFSCDRLIEEMKHFVINKSGKPEAEYGFKDDLVMAMAITLHVLKTRAGQLRGGTDWEQIRRQHGLTDYMGYNQDNSKWL